MKSIQQTKPIEAPDKDHSYRKRVRPGGLLSFRVLIKETDLLVNAVKDLSIQTKDSVHHYRSQIEHYIRSDSGFLSTRLPYPDDPFAPDIIKEMISSASIFGVGPMAAVAGTIAEFVGRDLLRYSDEVIVENGGDIFLKTARPVTVSIFAGTSPLSGKLGLIIPAEQTPLGVCTSSATVGHSLSLGKTDAACIVARSASVADAAATAIGNSITNRSDLNREIELVRERQDIMGGVVILGKAMGTWGDIELTEIE